MPIKLPLILGHRGNLQEHGYENTVPAIEFACEKVDGLETDIVLSKDNECFVIHDTFYSGFAAEYELNIRLDEASKSRANNRRIDQMTADEIKTLDLVNQEKIPTLDDLSNLVRKYPDKLFDIELKASDTGIKTAKELEGCNNYFFTSFNFPELLRIRNTAPSVPLGVLLEASNTKGCPMYPWLENGGEGYYTPLTSDAINADIIKDINPEYFAINEYDFRPEIIREILGSYPTTKIIIWWYFKTPHPSEDDRLIHTLYQMQREGLWDKLAAIISGHPAEMKQMITKEFGDK